MRIVNLKSEHSDFSQLDFDQTPVWSLDSEWLLFVVRNEEESRLAVSGRAAGYLALPLPEFPSGPAASWSVNSELAVASKDGVVIVEFTGDPDTLLSDEIRILPTPEPDSITDLQWSPDGSRLSVSIGGVSGSSLWILSTDGSDPNEVADSFGHDLMLYDHATSSLTRLTDTMFSGPLQSAAVWRSASAVTEPMAPTATPPATSTSESDEGADDAQTETRTVEPTPVPTDDPRAQEANDQVRVLLGYPHAEFTVDSIDDSSGRTIVEISRPIPGTEASDQFVIDIDEWTIFTAVLRSNSSLVQPENPVTVDEARAIAEAFHQERNTFSIPLLLADELPYSVDGVADGSYDSHGVVWQAIVNGVWLPTTVVVVVDLETGLVSGYSRTAFPYDGTLTPAVDRSEAHEIARAAIAEDPKLAGSTIDRVRLAVAFGELDEATTGSRVEADRGRTGDWPGSSDSPISPARESSTFFSLTPKPGRCSCDRVRRYLDATSRRPSAAGRSARSGDPSRGGTGNWRRRA
jgi:hypothetical protein